MIIFGNNINLRDLKKNDASSLAKNANSRAVSRFTFLPYPYDLHAADSFIKSANKNIKLGNAYELGIEKDGKIIGVISLMQINYCHKKADLGFWLGKEYWRKGLMSEALKIIKSFAFHELKLNRLSAVVLKGNTSSAQLLKKNGFSLEGTYRRFAILRNKTYDGLLFGLVRPKK